MEIAKIGIIGGSGLYQMPELEDVEEIQIDTPFGSPELPLVKRSPASARSPTFGNFSNVAHH